jgi:hypothetical protein
MADDTLRSRQDMRILLAVSEGEIESIDEIYLNDVTINSFNCDFAKTTGKLNQKGINGFDDLAGGSKPSSGGIEVKKGGMPKGSTNTTGDFPAVPARFYNLAYETTFVRVLIQMDSLFLHKKDGSSKETEMDFTIWVWYSSTIIGETVNINEYNGATSTNIKKKGLSMSKYSTAIEIDRPILLTNTNGFWHVMVVRNSPDALTDAVNVGEIEYYSSVSKVVLTEYVNADNTTYAGTALLAVRIEDASMVGNNFPTVSAKGKGLKLKVPISTYYNSIDRKYLKPMWNGKFEPTKKYTNNLSWVVYNLISDALTVEIPNEVVNNVATYTSVVLGCGIPEEFIAKYSFDKFAKYCDDILHVDYGLIQASKIENFTKTYNNGTVQILSNYLGSLEKGDFIVVTGVNGNYNTTDNVYGTTVSDIVTEGNKHGIRYTQGSGNADEVIDVTNAVVRYYKKSNILRRYSVNGQFLERKEAETFINDILSIGNCFLAEVDGLVSIQYDCPLTPTEINDTLIFTNQNVLDGLFEYSDSSLNETYTQVNVTIQDITNNNSTKTIVVSASDLIDWCNAQTPMVKPYYYYNNVTPQPSLPVNYFVNQFEFNVFDAIMEGTTDSRVAFRKGRSILWDSLMNSQIVSFKTLIQGSSLYKGQVIRVVDDTIINTEAKLTGRVKSHSISGGNLTIVFDRIITLDAGVAYSLTYMGSNSVPTITVANNFELVSNVTVNRAAGSYVATFTKENHGLLNSDFIAITPDNATTYPDFAIEYVKVTVIDQNNVSFLTASSSANAKTVTCSIDKLLVIQSVSPETVTIPSNSSVRNISSYTFTSTNTPISDSNFAFINNEPKLFKVLSTVKEDDYYVTSCIRYDLNKFIYIDSEAGIDNVTSPNAQESRYSVDTTVRLPDIDKVLLKTKWKTNTFTTYNADKTTSPSHTVNLTVVLSWNYNPVYTRYGNRIDYFGDYILSLNEEDNSFNSQYAVHFEVQYSINNGVTNTIVVSVTTATIDLVFTTTDDEINTPIPFTYSIVPKSGLPNVVIIYPTKLSQEYTINPDKQTISLIAG